MNETALVNTQTGEVVEKKQSIITLDDLKKQFCPTATDKELAIACGVISSFGLNPYKREVHLIKYQSTQPLQIIVGYEVYLKRAERTGKLDGWKVEIVDAGKSARCTIWRKDFTQPFEWTVDASEFNKGQSTWKAMPSFMLKKVCIAQAFRICFSDDLGGLPYTKEENDIIQAENTVPAAAQIPQKASNSTQGTQTAGNQGGNSQTGGKSAEKPKWSGAQTVYFIARDAYLKKKGLEGDAAKAEWRGIDADTLQEKKNVMLYTDDELGKCADRYNALMMAHTISSVKEDISAGKDYESLDGQPEFSDKDVE